MIDEDKRKHRVEISKTDGFNAFMRDESVKFLISQVPPTKEDLLEVLLRKAYNTGHIDGAGMIMIDLLQEVILAPRKPK